jgi:REP element-mobilizing transposase RayT
VPAVKKHLWGGAFWSDGYDISTAGRHSSEGEIRRYIATQGRQKEYSRLHTQQLRLF